MKTKVEKMAKAISEAIGEEVLNATEMEAIEGGGNVLSDCSGTTNNCKDGNCAAGCGATVPIKKDDGSNQQQLA